MAAVAGRTSTTVFCGGRRKSSGLLEAAEDLVDSLDTLEDILNELEGKYKEPNGNEDEEATGVSMFNKLKDGMEAVRSLILCLKQEKIRLTKRELSVELRSGELDEYKSHIKQDLTSLNDTVDQLSARVIQLENSLCEDQEIQEGLQAEKTELQQRLKAAEDKIQELDRHKSELLEDLMELRRQRTDSYVRKENVEIKSEVEVLLEENRRLKEMLRNDDPGEVVEKHNQENSV